MPHPARLKPSRRQFTFGLGAVVLTLASAKAWATSHQDQADGNSRQSGQNPAGGPLFRLRAAAGSLRLRPAPFVETPVCCFNGMIPGPLLRVRQGQRLAIELENALPEPLSLHWHGAGAPNLADGVSGLTGQAIAPGETQVIAFEARHAGVFWYRPMTIGSVGRQTENGLYGALIVDEAEPPAVEKDILLVLDDWALDDNARLRPDFDTVAARAGAGRLGNWLTLNSAAPPERITATPGARLRLRLLNAANARPFPLQFNGLNAHIIAIDGRPSEVFRPAHDSLTLMPGGRYDMIVEAPADSGAEGTVIARLGAGTPLLVIKSEAAPPNGAKAPLPAVAGAITTLPHGDLPASISLQNSARATLVLAGGAPPGASNAASKFTDPGRIWTVNNISWPDAMTRPAFSVRSGRPVTLELRNTTSWMQVLHVHGHHVRRLHNLDDGWEPYWLDVIAIPAGQTARIAFNAGEPGKWLIGSAIAERLDGGMATWFQVTP